MAEPTTTIPHDDSLPCLPPGTPAWITPTLVQQTIEVWQPRYQEQLTVEDAVAMILAVSHLFRPA